MHGLSISRVIVFLLLGCRDGYSEYPCSSWVLYSTIKTNNNYRNGSSLGEWFLLECRDRWEYWLIVQKSLIITLFRILYRQSRLRVFMKQIHLETIFPNFPFLPTLFYRLFYLQEKKANHFLSNILPWNNRRWHFIFITTFNCVTDYSL